ncbi:PQQ-binding-like beta-propeller repeat protein [Streptomyces capitiformicae]|nr:PQQ-binding-like beta-propeller repeat protein [Streptomyces capitiformicae]
MALDLENGALLWRHGPSLRPCALLAGSIVALRISPAPTLVVVVLDAATGEDRWTSEPAGEDLSSRLEGVADPREQRCLTIYAGTFVADLSTNA